MLQPGGGAALAAELGQHVIEFQNRVVGRCDEPIGKMNPDVIFQNRALRRGHIQFVSLQLDGRDAEVFQRAQFARVGFPVLIQILPNAQFCKDCIGRINDAVTVKVVCGQFRNTRHTDIAEEFVDIVNPAIAILVQRKKPVIGRNPAGAFTEEITVGIKKHARSGTRHGLDPIAIKVDDQRVLMRGPACVLADFQGGVVGRENQIQHWQELQTGRNNPTHGGGTKNIGNQFQRRKDRGIRLLE